MADLNRDPPVDDIRRPDRGQLLFITALGLAIVFVVLALVVNSTIGIGPLSSRSDVVDDGRDALRYETDVRRSSASVLTVVNSRNDSSYVDLHRGIHRTVQRWNELSGRQAARDGRWTDVRIVGTTNGTTISQTAPDRNLTNVDGNATWTLVTNVTGARQFRMNLSGESLVDPATDEPNASELVDAGTFAVAVEGENGPWRTFVYRDGPVENGSVVVAIEEPDGTLRSACRAAFEADGRATIDLTRGSVAGAPCPELDVFERNAAPFDIGYERSRSANGTYTLVVDRSTEAIDNADYGPRDGDSAPFVTPTLYDVTLEVTYETPVLHRVASLRIAPGEPDG